MTARPPRDLREEAKRALARRLRHAECAIPDALAAELLVCLDGIHIGLVDTSRPADPNADAFTRPTDPIPAAAAAEAPTPGLAEYLAAKATRATAPIHRPQKGQP